MLRRYGREPRFRVVRDEFAADRGVGHIAFGRRFAKGPRDRIFKQRTRFFDVGRFPFVFLYTRAFSAGEVGNNGPIFRHRVDEFVVVRGQQPKAEHSRRKPR